MEHIYHFSHFFEFIGSLYFASLALFEIISKESKVIRTYGASNIIFIPTNITDTTTKKTYNIAFYRSTIILFIQRELLSLYNDACRILNEQYSESNQKIARLYYPSFFYAGCYCLILVFLSPILYSHEEYSKETIILTENFINNYSLLSIISYTLLLFILPTFVGKSDSRYKRTISLFAFGCIFMAIGNLIFCNDIPLIEDISPICNLITIDIDTSVLTLFICLVPMIFLFYYLIYFYLLLSCQYLIRHLLAPRQQ